MISSLLWRSIGEARNKGLGEWWWIMMMMVIVESVVDTWDGILFVCCGGGGADTYNIFFCLLLLIYAYCCLVLWFPVADKQKAICWGPFVWGESVCCVAPIGCLHSNRTTLFSPQNLFPLHYTLDQIRALFDPSNHFFIPSCHSITPTFPRPGALCPVPWLCAATGYIP